MQTLPALLSITIVPDYKRFYSIKFSLKNLTEKSVDPFKLISGQI